MIDTATPARRGWRTIERYAYVERPYEDVWAWVAAHLSALGAPLPGGGHAVELRIRPGGREVSRTARLKVGGVVADEQRARAVIGWADAAHPHLFPHLEAVLEIVPVPNDTRPFTQLGILARYRPPFGPLGAVGDRLVGAEVTEATLATFLDEVAAAVEDHTVTPSMGTPSMGAPSMQTGAAPPRQEGEPAPGIERTLLMIDHVSTRTGGAAAAGALLAALPGVAHVSLDPWSGLVAVDHDPGVCDAEEMRVTLGLPAAVPPG